MPTNAINTTYIHDEDDESLWEHLGVVEDERNILLKEKEQIYEAIAGDDAINRYTHEEIMERIYQMYDAEQKLNLILAEVRFIKPIEEEGQ